MVTVDKKQAVREWVLESGFRWMEDGEFDEDEAFSNACRVFDLDECDDAICDEFFPIISGYGTYHS
ncbi:MAG: hypothetical protein NUW00_03535 [Candidatus Kaiserbacteria bacterium]|nr:hypothetical protein [Candidatus Kaiserbacteria bacterium]MCR4330429.1 hypothetical protein [Patescibacteria group bacterium]